jgi:hypothetical protein
MASPSKAEAAAALTAAGIERTAFSIKEFCARNGGLSEGFYQSMRKRGLGPKETRVLNRVWISIEAETAWRRAREAATSDENTAA